jgi:hypothetical protein
MAGGGGGVAGLLGRRVEGGEENSGLDPRRGVRGGGASVRVCGVAVIEGSARGGWSAPMGPCPRPCW